MAESTIKGMERYYAVRAQWYDWSMGYTREDAESRLKPHIDFVQRQLQGRDVLELACGPGFWTGKVSAVARSVLAVDLNEEMLCQARMKDYPNGNVRFLADDIYALNAVTGRYMGGLAYDWFSHVAKSRIGAFFNAFHSKLQPGARVVMIDSARDWQHRQEAFARIDEEGNEIHTRPIYAGIDNRQVIGTAEIIKNFPSELDMHDYLAGLAGEIEYRVVSERWQLAYTVISGNGTGASNISGYLDRPQ